MSIVKATSKDFSQPTVYTFYIIGVVTTIFDAAASYISIISASIAEEGNWLLNQVFGALIENGASKQLAFGVTMGLRTLFGIALLTALLYIAQRSKKLSERRIATIGLIITSAILSLLAVYHTVGLLLFG